MHDAHTQKFKIGAAERLTGIPAVTIRMWERRYGVVQPERTPGNGRLYSRSQLARLTLLRRLVDAGHAISTVASLSDAELGERVGALEDFRPQHEGPVAIAIVGASLALQAREGIPAGGNANLLPAAIHDSADAAFAESPPPVDVLIVEQPIINPETVRGIGALARHYAASVTVVVYQFAPSGQLAILHRAGFHTVSAPTRLDSLQRMLPALLGTVPQPEPDEIDEGPELWMHQPPPARRYTPLELHRWAKRSSSVRCECPEHLVSLVTRLVAFEDYSRDCENRNAADATIHMMLHHTTAQARRALEDALAHLVAHEFPDESTSP